MRKLSLKPVLVCTGALVALALAGSSNAAPVAESSPADVYAAQLRNLPLNLDSKTAVGEPTRGSRAVPFSSIRRASVGNALPGVFYNASGAIGPGGLNSTYSARISRDGNYVAFETVAPLDPNDTNNVGDIYRLDIAAGTVTLVSGAFGLTGTPDGSPVAQNPNFRVGAYGPAVNGDGTVVVFNSGLILNDTHDTFTWASDRVGGASAGLWGGGPNGVNDVASEETFTYYAVLDGAGAITDLRIMNTPGDALPDFSPGIGFITPVDISDSGSRALFFAGNMNTGLGSNTSDDESWQGQAYVYDATANAGAGGAFVATNDAGNALADANAGGLWGYSISGDGNWISYGTEGFDLGTGTYPIYYAGSIQSPAASDPFADTFVVNVTNPAAPGPVLRLPSLLDGVTPSVANNTSPDNSASAGPAFAVTGGAGVSGALFVGGDWNSTGTKLAVLTNPDTSIGFPSLNQDFLQGSVAVKDRVTGALELVATNSSYQANYITSPRTIGPRVIFPPYSRPFSAWTRWSADDDQLVFNADWDPASLGSAAPLADWLDFAGSFAVAYPPSTFPASVADYASLQVEGATSTAILNPFFSSTPDIADTVAIFSVYDGVTFAGQGDSSLFADLGIRDFAGTPGSQISRTTLGPVAGDNGNDLSARGAASDDGSVVAFVSYAANIVDDAADDQNGAPDVFVIDMATSATTIASRSGADATVTANRASANQGSLGGATFEYLMTGVGSGSVTQWHSISSIDISGDGNFVVFPSIANDMGAVGTTAGAADVSTAVGSSTTAQVYRFDATTGVVTIVSDAGSPANTDYVVGNATSYNPSVSDNGQFVAYQTLADNLVALGGVSDWNIAVRDLSLGSEAPGATTIVSQPRDGGGVPSGNYSETENIFPQISGDGSKVVWQSLDDILAADADLLNQEYDIYLWDRVADEVRLVSGTDGNTVFVPTPVTGDPNGWVIYSGTNTGFRFDSIRPGMSNNGEYVTFLTRKPLDTANDPDAGDVLTSPLDATQVNGYAFQDLYIYNDVNRTVRYIDGSGNDTLRYANARGWSRPSDDGRFVAAWVSENFAAADTNDAGYDLYVLDRFDETWSLASRSAGGDVANTANTFFSDTAAPQFSLPSIASDGSVVTFDTSASNLLPGSADANAQRDVYQVVLGTPTDGPAGAVGSWSMYQ